MKISTLKYLVKNELLVSFSDNFLFEKPTYRRGAILDISCENTPSIINSITKERAFGLHTVWLLLNIGNSTDDFHNNKGVISSSYALPDSFVVMAQIYEEEGMVELYEIYRCSMEAEMKFVFLSRQYLSSIMLQSQKKERTDFEGVTIRAAFSILFPKIFEGFTEDPRQPEVDTYAKLGHVSLKNIARQFNFSFTVSIFNSYGYLVNGSFTDLMGTLVKGDLDVGIGLNMRDDRIDFIDFAGNLFIIKSPLIFKQPPLSTVSNIFILPFHKYVWMISGIMAFSIFIILSLELFISYRINQEKKYSLLEVAMSIIEEVCQQGSSIELKLTGAKFTGVLFSVVSFFLFIAYSAKIVAFLQSTTPTIKSLSQLTKSHMAVGMQDIVYNRMNFKETKDFDVQEFYKKKIYPLGDNVYFQELEGILKIRTHFFAYKVETNWAYKFINEFFTEQEKCGLSEIVTFIVPTTSFGFPKKSGIREHFSRSMIWQQESGVFQQSRKKFLLQKPACNAKTAGYTKVHLIDFYPALLIFLYGSSASLLIFVIEVSKIHIFLSNIYSYFKYKYLVVHNKF